MAAYREKTPRFKISYAHSQSCFAAVQGSASQIKKTKSFIQELLINLQQCPRAESAHAAVRIRTTAAAQTGALHRPVAWL